MKLISLKLNNFLSHKYTDIDFSEGLLGVIGSNGSGKSSLFKDSITWCLWGKSRSSGAGDELIFEGKKECIVAVGFSVNGTSYSVVRKRHKAKKTELFLSVWEGEYGNSFENDLSKAVLKDTQEEINKVLGMDYEVFSNSCCIEQGKFDSFSNLTPKEASNVILSILQLDRYSKYRDVANKRFSEIVSEIEKLELANSYLADELSKLQTIDAIKDQKKIELSSLIQNEQVLAQQYKVQENELNERQLELQKVTFRFKEISGQLNEIESQLTKLSKQSDIINKINGKCIVCRSKIDAIKKEEIKRTLLTEYQNTLDKKISLNAEEENLSAVQTTLKKVLELNFAKSLRDKLTDLRTKITSIESELKVLESNSEDNLKKVSSQIVLNEERREILGKNKLIFFNLVDAFSHKGIPLLIIDNVIKELEILVNNNLSLLTDIPIKVEFYTQRESSSGDLLDTFQILIRNGLNTRSYFNYSGGEKLVIDLSIRLGLSELLARRNNFKVETLIIDEGLGSLDDSNQVNFLNTLNKLTSKFSNVIVITHTEVKEYFKKYAEVKKENDISRVYFSDKNVL